MKNTFLLAIAAMAVCALLATCTLAASSSADAITTSVSMAASTDSIDNANFDATCEICKFIVKQLEQYVNKTEPEIEKALVHLCSYLPGAEAQQICDTIVLMYGHQIVTLILKFEQPSLVCQQIHMCSADVKQQKAEEEPKALAKKAEEVVNNDSTSCVLCSLFIASIEDYISRNKTEKEVENILHMVCTHYLPMAYVESCENMIDTYLPQMINYVKQKYPARVICEDLKLCSKNHSTSTSTSSEQQQAVASKPINAEQEKQLQCAMCSSILRIAKTIAKETRLQAQANQTPIVSSYPGASFKTLCEHFESAKNQAHCQQVMQQFKHKLILRVAQYKGSVERMNEYKVCKQVKAC